MTASKSLKMQGA